MNNIQENNNIIKSDKKMKESDFYQDLINLQDDLFRYALTLTCDIEKAKDLQQETSYRALVNKNKFEKDTNLKNWTFTIMRNLFINDYNRLAKCQISMCKLDDKQLNIGFDAKVDGIYDHKLVNKAISYLDERSRKIFGMYISDYKYDEIAEKMNMPLGSVKSQIHIVRHKLQNKLKELAI